MEKFKEIFESMFEMNIEEAVAAHGEELVAYCIVVAEEYTAMPRFDPVAVPLWDELIRHNQKMFDKVMRSVNVVYTDRDPYSTQRDMMFDILRNNRLQIFKTPDNDPTVPVDQQNHPGMTAEENDIFRTIHDYLGHHLPNAKALASYMAKNNVKSSGDSSFRAYRFSRNSFTVRGEMNTYLTHAKLVNDRVKPVLFTEIVGQICTFFTTGNFTVNKVGILPGIDFKNVGQFTSSQLNERKQKYWAAMLDDDIEKFQTNIGMFDKTKIRWNLLSRGEGASRG